MPDSDSLINLKEDYNMKNHDHYSILAEMFSYPSPKMKDKIESWKKIISGYDAEILTKLEPFISHITGKTLAVRQEYFISTFDVQPLCTLDIGYVLFGEDYRRGDFLVNMKKEHIKAGNDCGSELPDHLPNILSLIPRISDADLAEELIYSLMIPALHEMIFRFKNGDNLYKGLLEILVTIMESDYPVSRFERFSFRREEKNMVPGS